MWEVGGQPTVGAEGCVARHNSGHVHTALTSDRNTFATSPEPGARTSMLNSFQNNLGLSDAIQRAAATAGLLHC